MRTIGFAGVALVALLTSPAAIAQTDSGAPPVVASPPTVETHRWAGGEHAPGGWSSYRRPDFGYRLPSYWVAPGYFVSDLDRYDLPRPARGFGWSRYYDDAVLTDSWGRVYDSRSGIDWDRPQRHRKHRRWGNYGYESRWQEELHPHWLPYGDGYGEEVTTTVTTTPAPCVTTKTYKTSYDTVAVPRKRASAPRSKMIRLMPR